jgi:fructoselysine-6-P-deglycase FrlB-like protein
MRKRRKPSGPLDSSARRERLDPEDMRSKIEGFPEQLRAGAAIAAPAIARLEPQPPRAFVLIGMGGSAIAGDLIRILADREGAVPVHVVRHYEPPSWITPEDFLLFSSYSGETEETLSAYGALRRMGCRAAVLASGGSLARRAEADGLPVALLPGGLPPRAALGYAISALAPIAHHLGVLADADLPSQHGPGTGREAATAFSRTTCYSLAKRQKKSRYALPGIPSCWSRMAGLPSPSPGAGRGSSTRIPSTWPGSPSFPR